MGFGLYGTTFIIPLYTQATLGWTPTQAGLLMVPAALMTAFMMPLIGKLLTKGIPQQYLVSAGMLAFVLFCYWGYTIISPDTSKENFFWMLILRGIGLGLLFIPITALSLSTLKGRQIGDGAAFTGMMRQLGGSFGIALITTFMATKTMVHRADLVTKYDITNPVVMNKVEGYKQAFMAQGKPINIALQDAYKVMDLAVTKQAAVLSYMDVFMFTGVIFLICIPFVMMVKGNRGKKVDMSEAMH
jgi:DHA2 family multidrug resistance protein